MNLKHCLFLTAGVLSAGSLGAPAQTLTAGDLVVSTYGSTTNNPYLDGNPTTITLLEFSPAIAASSPILTLPLPTAASGANVGVVGEYGSSSEGNIQLSGDNTLLTICGYNAAQAAVGLSGTPYSNNSGTPLAQSTDTAVSRVAAFIDANGAVNSSTTFNNLYSTNNPRSFFSQDGTTLYISGQGSGTADQGLYYAQAGTQNQPTAIYTALDTRFTQVYGGNLYYSIDKKSKATGIFKFSGNPPTSAATAAQITPASGGGANYSPEGFYFANATTLYIADTGVPKNGGTSDGGLQKWTYNGSVWTLAYTFANPTNFISRATSSSATHGETGFAAVTGKVVNGVTYLYAVSYTAGDADPDGLYGLTDIGSGATFTEIASAPGIQVSGTVPNTTLSGNSPDYVFKGVSFAPNVPAAASDTPTLPTWALIAFGALLFLLAARFLPAARRF